MPTKISKKPRFEKVCSEDTDLTFSTENQENNGVEIHTVLSVFRECTDLHAHERLITQLKIEFYDKLNINEFCEDFFNCFRFILEIEDDTRSDIPIQFIIKFVISCLIKADNTDAKEKSLKFLKRLVKFAFEHHDCEQHYVRLHIVKTFKVLLNELNDDIDVPETFYDIIQDALLKRVWDVKPSIRAEAAQASSRLQNPSDAGCNVVISLTHLCKFDSSHKVRLSAMQSLAITTKSLPVIITRCRDVNNFVRKGAYDLLIKWKILKPLTVSKRLQIMENGLNDKSDIVKQSCIGLLKVWLHVSENDPVALLKRLDVETMEEATELTLKNLFQCLSEQEIITMVDFLSEKMNDKKIVLDEHMTSDMVFFWRHLVQFLNEKAEDNASQLERIIPSAIDFVLLLEKLLSKPIEQSRLKEVVLDEYLESYTIIKHLLPIVKYMDIYDEHNRKIMFDMVKLALSSPAIPFNYVEPLMKMLVHMESNNEKICNLTVELINELINEPGSESTVALSADTLQSVHNEPMIVDTGDNQPEIDPTVINREALRRNKLELAEIEVRINELNESMSNCRKENLFDKMANILVDLQALSDQKTCLYKQKDLLLNPIGNGNEDIIINTGAGIDGEPGLEQGQLPAAATDDEPMVGEPSERIKKEVNESTLWMSKGMESKIIKANVMTIVMIQECNLLWHLPPTLRTLFLDVILVSVQHSDIYVREKAIMAMGLCCLLDKEIAVKYYQIFIDSLHMDHDSIKEISLKSLIDMFIRFGIEPFQEAFIANKDAKGLLSSKTEESGSTLKLETSFISDATQLTEEDYNRFTTELMTPIIDLLNHQNTDIQTTVAIGLSKLLFSHKLLSSKLLSRLLLLWFNPSTDGNIKLRQYLAAFFTNYSLMSADNQEAITNCFLTTMRTLFRAPADSPLLEIQFTNVIEFFERVTDSKYLIENRDDNVDKSKLNNPCHDQLAMIICNQILQSPLNIETKYYIPMLTRLRLSPCNVDMLTKLTPLIATIITKVKEKKWIAALEKLHNTLSIKLEQMAAEAEDPNETLVKDETVIEPAPSSDVNLENQTPASSRPSLLELGSDGRKMNATYLSRRINKTLNISDSDSPIRSVADMNESTLDEEDENMDGSTVRSGSISDISKLPPDNSADDNIFRKPLPRNIRVTRSSSKLNSSSGSTASARKKK